jgi:hypothetical protein
MKIRIIVASILAIGGVATATVAAPTAGAMPACQTTCYTSGTWFWNKQSAQYQLLISGIDVGGHHYEVSNAVCYGVGHEMWGSKGPEFQQFHCAVKPFDMTGTNYNNFGLTFYVRGHYAWTWRA